MAKTDLTADTWVTAFTGVTDQVFTLTNEGPATDQFYRIAWGSATPTDDAESISIVLKNDEPSRSITFSNSASMNVYIKSVRTDGSCIS